MPAVSSYPVPFLLFPSKSSSLCKSSAGQRKNLPYWENPSMDSTDFALESAKDCAILFSMLENYPKIFSQ